MRDNNKRTNAQTHNSSMNYLPNLLSITSRPVSAVSDTAILWLGARIQIERERERESRDVSKESELSIFHWWWDFKNLRIGTQESSLIWQIGSSRTTRIVRYASGTHRTRANVRFSSQFHTLSSHWDSNMRYRHINQSHISYSHINQSFMYQSFIYHTSW